MYMLPLQRQYANIQYIFIMEAHCFKKLKMLLMVVVLLTPGVYLLRLEWMTQKCMNLKNGSHQGKI